MSRWTACVVATVLIVSGCSDRDDGEATVESQASVGVSPSPRSPETSPSIAGSTTAQPALDQPATDPAPASTEGVQAGDPTRPRPAPEGGGTATGALSDADVQIVTDEGVVQIGVAEVPSGVSADFPIPADLRVELSSSTGSDFGFSGVSGLEIDELAAFYEAGLGAAGYAITARQEVSGVLAVFSFERVGETGQVAISEAPGGAGTSVLVAIADTDSAGG